MQLMSGKLNAQSAFMKGASWRTPGDDRSRARARSGKIKLKGNMMLAQKLSLLSTSAPPAAAAATPSVAAPAAKAAPAPAAAAPSTGGASGFKAAALFDQMKGSVNAELVAKVKASYRFDVSRSVPDAVH